MAPAAAPDHLNQNPFTTSDPERRALWDMLVKRDFEAFLAGDWSRMEPDFWRPGFYGIDARQSSNPDQWQIAFPSVESYRDEWLRQAAQFQKYEFPGTDKLSFLYGVARLDDIKIVGDRGMAHKKFDGSATTVDGQEVVLCFQSVFQLVRVDRRWKISGFVGYLPNPMP